MFSHILNILYSILNQTPNQKWLDIPCLTNMQAICCRPLGFNFKILPEHYPFWKFLHLSAHHRDPPYFQQMQAFGQVLLELQPTLKTHWAKIWLHSGQRSYHLWCEPKLEISPKYLWLKIYSFLYLRFLNNFSKRERLAFIVEKYHSDA